MSLKLLKLNPELYTNGAPSLEPVPSFTGITGFKAPQLKPVMSGQPPASSGRSPAPEPRFTKAASKGVSFIDKLTKLPGKVSEIGDRWNDKAISFAQDLEKAAASFSKEGAAVAEKNLKRNKINTIARQAGNWLQDNVLLAGGIFLVVGFLLYRGITK